MPDFSTEADVLKARIRYLEDTLRYVRNRLRLAVPEETFAPAAIPIEFHEDRHLYDALDDAINNNTAGEVIVVRRDNDQGVPDWFLRGREGDEELGYHAFDEFKRAMGAADRE